MLVCVVNTRGSLDEVPIILFHVPLGELLNDWMFWAVIALAGKSVGGPTCDITEAMLLVTGEG
jgi:hypothetical protein